MLPCPQGLLPLSGPHILPVSKDLRKSGSKRPECSPDPLYDHGQMLCHPLGLSFLISKMELDCL